MRLMLRLDYKWLLLIPQEETGALLGAFEGAMYVEEKGSYDYKYFEVQPHSPEIELKLVQDCDIRLPENNDTEYQEATKELTETRSKNWEMERENKRMRDRVEELEAKYEPDESVSEEVDA